MALIRFLTLLALGGWIGSIVLFSFVVAPSAFGVLAPAQAGAVVGAMFPHYYALDLAAAALALAGILVLARVAGGRAWRLSALAVAAGLIATACAAGVVYPRTQRLRAEAQAAGRPPGEDPAFRAAHRDAVVLNGAALAAALAALAGAAVALRE